MVEVADTLIMLEKLKIMETQLFTLTSLLPPLLKWLQCSPRSMGCLFHLRCNNWEEKFHAWKLLIVMNTLPRMGEVGSLQLVIMLKHQSWLQRKAP